MDVIPTGPAVLDPTGTDSVPSTVEGVKEEITREADNATLSQQSTAYPVEFYDRFLSAQSKKWRVNAIRGVMYLEDAPGILSLLAGKPNASTFPITSFSMTVRSPVPPFTPTTLELKDRSVTEALQYGPLIGNTDLVVKLFELQEALHGRKRDPSWRISVCAGGMDVVYKVVQTLTDPGDVILVEAPTFAGALPSMQARDAEFVQAPVDGNGIISSELRKMLENWPVGKAMPKYLYTIPFGCNPSGATASIERRREVLELARKYQFLIFEDDPYYLLYYGERERPASYFELEAQDGHPTGIVIRSDSFSKVLSAGVRIGFVSGPKCIVDKVDLFTSQSNLQPSSLSQSVALAVLEQWGIDGFKEHAKTVAQFYNSRRKVFEAAMKKHLDGLVEYSSPVAGMFLWFKLLIPPAHDVAAEGDSYDLITSRAFKAGVLACPGTSFFADDRKSAYVRAAFSVLNDEQTDEALRRLAGVVRQVREELGHAN